MTLVVFPCELVSFSLFPLDRISEMQRKQIVNSPSKCKILHQFFTWTQLKEDLSWNFAILILQNEKNNDNNVLKPTILQ